MSVSRIALLVALLALPVLQHAQTAGLAPTVQRHPAWFRENGIVMAGAWESLAYLQRGDATETYEQKLEGWRRGHSEEIARRLKDMGFNFLMIPFYKGFGLHRERDSMEDAKRFTQVCHRLGLRVGAYVFSGSIAYESVLSEEPGAQNWFIRDPDGRYVYYDVKYHRRWVNRSHPGVRTHVREAVRFAIQEAGVDLLHFDNYAVGPAYEPFSVAQFREYLSRKYTPEERVRRFGFAVVDHILPPPPPPQPDRYNIDPLYQEFVDYRTETVADTFRELAEYARSLNPDIMVELNPLGYRGELNGQDHDIGAMDHTLVLPWGGAFWDEGLASRLENGRVISRFRSHKLGRQFNNTVFQYTADPVAMAESMANGLQTLGCPVWFAGGRIVPTASARSGSEIDPFIFAAIRFFQQQQRYFRDTEEIADAGVLNTYANTAYGPRNTRERLAAFEQALYQARLPFTLVPGRYPGNLGRFRVLVLADLALISDSLVNAVRDYVRAGGGLVITGRTAEFDERHRRRERPGFADIFPTPRAGRVVRGKFGKGRVVYVPQVEIRGKFQPGVSAANRGLLIEAVRWAAGTPLSFETTAPETVAASYYRQPGGRRLVHLVNYDTARPASNIQIKVQMAPEERRVSVVLLAPGLKRTQTIPHTHAARQLAFAIPQLRRYALVVIEPQP